MFINRKGENMKFYLVRHGSQISPLCNDNTDLSKNGILEIQKLGQRLSSYSIDVIYSSQLKRAIQSAEIPLKSQWSLQNPSR